MERTALFAESAGADPFSSSGVKSTGLPTPYLVFIGGPEDLPYAKTAMGLRDWARENCIGELAVGDSTIGLPRLSAAEARQRGAKAIVIGVAGIGGAIDPRWRPALRSALEAGLDLVSGMHGRLSDDRDLVDLAQRSGSQLIDVRVPPSVLPIASGRKRSGQRLLTVGTDCAIGKKYTALALTRAFKARGIAADFRATGQTGIMIAGGGIPMDAVVSDFAAGAAELLSPDAPDDHWDVIEGQGSLFHPSYAGVSLALLHGSQPDCIVVCHAPDRTEIMGLTGYPLRPIEQVIEDTLSMARLTNGAVRCGGVALNTGRLDARAAEREIQSMIDRTGLPAADPVRQGQDFDLLVDNCLESSR
jgi:uncharacterized NAD-dependent epimerase/dehydratase family protein